MPSAADIIPGMILDSTSNGVIATDTQGTILAFNQEAGRLLGGTRLALGEPLKDGLPEIWNLAARCLADNTSLLGQLLQTETRTLLVNVSPLRRDGVVEGAVCNFQDVRVYDGIAKKMASYQEINQQLESIINSSEDGIWIIDSEGMVLRINAASEEMHGFTMAQVANMHVLDLQAQGFVEKVVSAKVLETRQKVTELTTIRGKQVLATGSPVFSDEGEIMFVVVNERDMTELNALREQSEQSLQKMDLYKEELNKLRMLELDRHGIIAESDSMRGVLQTALKLARLGVSNVLIRGESGTGKGLIAKYIHSNSRRKDRPFIHINCAAIPENLLESELFGYETGAFTGAHEQGKPGLIELAHEGTLFLDEIGDMPLPIQAKVLNYLDDNTVRRVGGTISRHVDCVVLAATNRDLAELAAEKKFRQDLFYRLNTFPISLLPLHERAEDIPLLAMHYIESYSQEYHLKRRATPAALLQLQKRRYNGNVRELRNLIKRAVILSDQEVIDSALVIGEADEHGASVRSGDMQEHITLKEHLASLERNLFQNALNRGRTTREMARTLGIDHSTVVRKLKKHGLQPAGAKQHQ